MQNIIENIIDIRKVRNIKEMIDWNCRK